MTQRPRQLLRTGSASVAAALLSGAVPAAQAAPDTPPQAAETRRPNVIIILADDLGYGDLGCMGAKDLKTPAVDSLAATGTLFTRFYAASSVCSPSRASLLTGRYPLRAGLPGNSPSQRNAPGGLPVDQVTMAQTFQAAGYATAHIGKWHLGYTPPQMPNQRGFDESFGHMGGCIDNYSHFFYWDGPNVHDLWRNGQEVHEDGRFFPDLMVQDAARFLKANRERPFFLFFAMNLPHYPYQPVSDLREQYRSLPYPRDLYGAFVATMDARIGQLMQQVDGLGLRDETIVIFQSDNGYSTEERAHFGGGSAGGLRGAKFSLFEGGIRVPAIISWPGHIPQGAVRQQVAHGADWLPTLADLTGVPLLEPDIDGKGLGGVIQSPEAASPHEVLHWQNGRGTNAQWAVREGEWKLIANVTDTSPGAGGAPRIPLWLSNIAKDPEETRNYADDNPAVVARLRRLHDTWAAQAERPATRAVNPAVQSEK